MIFFIAWKINGPTPHVFSFNYEDHEIAMYEADELGVYIGRDINYLKTCIACGGGRTKTRHVFSHLISFTCGKEKTGIF